MKRLLLAVALLLALGSQRTDAYVTWGPVWGNSTVTYKINPTDIFGLADADIINAVTASADAWHTNSSANITLSYGGTTAVTTAGNDGTNAIIFRNETNGGFIAYTWDYTDSSGHIIGFDVIFYEALVPMFPDATTCSGGISIRETALHELGHALGLMHSQDASAIMYADVGYCDPRTSLATDDIAGINFLYPPSGGSSGGPTEPPTEVTVPGLPASPSPRNGSSAPRNADLAWTSGSGAVVHDVFFGACTSNPPLYAQNLPSASLALPKLNALTKYCWRVVERNSAGDTVGPLWNFTTRKN